MSKTQSSCKHHDRRGSDGLNDAISIGCSHSGIVQTDGYAGYDFLDSHSKIIHSGCLAHARRKFDEAAKGQSKGKSGSAHVALKYIAKLYRIESEAQRKKLTPEQLLAVRHKQAKPLVDEFLLWLQKKASQVVPKSLLGTAVRYTLNQWDRLVVYLPGTSGNDTRQQQCRECYSTICCRQEELAVRWNARRSEGECRSLQPDRDSKSQRPGALPIPALSL
nr:transposase [uncultured Desulfobulbus sp.]